MVALKTLLVKASTKSPPCGTILTYHYADALKVELQWQQRGNELDCGGSFRLATDSAIARFLAKQAAGSGLLGTTPIENAQVESWIYVAESLQRADMPMVLELLGRMEKSGLAAGNGTSLVGGQSYTIADFLVFSALQGPACQKVLPSFPNVFRFYNQILADAKLEPAHRIIAANAEPIGISGVNGISDKQDGTPSSGQAAKVQKDEGKFVELPNAEMGKVVVRFPPEASGYLHIGHAKAALVNAHYQKTFKGKLILRFDDTNPAKESAEFEQAILEDLSQLEVYPDIRTHTSDHFDMMLGLCEQLIKEGLAYADDTDAETMKAERDQRADSKNRANTPEQNLKMWEQMKLGTEEGRRCAIRLKVDMKHDNGCMRDPTIYRCKPEPHIRTGHKYKVYPTYDFACPIVDSIEGVTHALRTTEYHDRDEQYFFILDALKMRKPHIWEYARLNMMNTVMSKRKLTWLVDEGIVDGWDDPRFPTVRGIVRRGLTIEALSQFTAAQGGSRSIVAMEWDKLWAFNKKVIDPVAPRYTALLEDHVVPVKVNGASVSSAKAQLHPKDTSVGEKTVWYSDVVLVEGEDAEVFKLGEVVTFINWGNLIIKKIDKDSAGVVTNVEAELNLDNKDYKKTTKVTWLADTKGLAEMTPAVCVHFDHIINKPVVGKDEDFKQFVNRDSRHYSKMMGDHDLRNLKKGNIIQLQRRGYYICDQPWEEQSNYTGKEVPCVLLHIPDGHTKENAAPKAPTGKAHGKSVGSPAKVAASPVTTSTPAGTTSGGDLCELDKSIRAQGDAVRALKTAKADKVAIKMAVDQLLSLKVQFKSTAGSDWKPEFVPPSKAPANTVAEKDNSSTGGGDLDAQIRAQGDLVRQKKADKADKSAIKQAVDKLLALKADFKSTNGVDWKPDAVPPPSAAPNVAQSSPAVASAPSSAGTLDSNIRAQGDVVRKLKSDKADKSAIKQAVDKLLALKAEFKSANGVDWKPDSVPPPSAAPSAPQPSPAVVNAPPSAAPDDEASGNLDSKIRTQGDLVRKLKSDKTDKSTIKQAVDKLLALKAEFKAANGVDWKPDAVPPPSAAPSAAQPSPAVASAPPSAGTLDSNIRAQGDVVRKLKSDKVDKESIKKAVDELLRLKAEFKSTTGAEWKPDTAVPPAVHPHQNPVSDDPLVALDAEIRAQGDLVRKLKTDKADKATVKLEVDKLLALKNQFMAGSGSAWTPENLPPAANTPTLDLHAKPSPKSNSGSEAQVLDAKIRSQTEKVADLEASKSDKVGELSIGADATSPTSHATGAPMSPGKKVRHLSTTEMPDDPLLVSGMIRDQGDKIRALKQAKVDKVTVKSEVDKLLSLKHRYKHMTGNDWGPDTPFVAVPAGSVDGPSGAGGGHGEPPDASEVTIVSHQIAAQEAHVASITNGGEGTEKASLELAEVILQSLYNSYTSLTGQEWEQGGGQVGSAIGSKNTPSAGKTKTANDGTGSGSGKKKGGKTPKEVTAKKSRTEGAASQDGDEGKGGDAKKQSRLGMEVKKSENFADWYSQVITKGELIDYHDVSGCYIIRPWAFAIWEAIQKWFDGEIKKLGVKNCYFPLFVSQAALEKEKDHIADFAPEVAWVTRSGDSELDVPIAIRPTSETVMYPTFARWVQSHRDLPIRVNQWCSVVRWEFKHPTPFIRTREFLWQEGHTAWADKENAVNEVFQILDLYSKVYTDLLAIPVVKGRKTEKEKFPGGDFTTTVEGYVGANGRAIQAATSHHLGQNFSKMFDITFENPTTQEKEYAHQNSWGLSTRSIGVLTMVHGDDNGLVMPPRVAKIQVIIVPCGVTASLAKDKEDQLKAVCASVLEQLQKVGVRCQLDARENISPGWKFNHWELKGVPIRLEIGPRDVQQGQVVMVRRDTGTKATVKLDGGMAAYVTGLLDTIQSDMYARVKKEMDDHIVVTDQWAEFCSKLEQKCLIQSPFCGQPDCETKIKADSASVEADPNAPSMGAKSLCIPFDQPGNVDGKKCVRPDCGQDALFYTMFGRSY